METFGGVRDSRPILTRVCEWWDYEEPERGPTMYYRVTGDVQPAVQVVDRVEGAERTTSILPQQQSRCGVEENVPRTNTALVTTPYKEVPILGPIMAGAPLQREVGTWKTSGQDARGDASFLSISQRSTYL